MVDKLLEGLTLFTGDPSSATPVAAHVGIPRESRGYGWVSVVIASHASDTCTVAIHGKMAAGDTYKALKKADESTAASIAQSGGALTNVSFSCQLMPYMKVVLSGTSTSGASAKVWLEAALDASSRTDS